MEIQRFFVAFVLAQMVFLTIGFAQNRYETKVDAVKAQQNLERRMEDQRKSLLNAIHRADAVLESRINKRTDQAIKASSEQISTSILEKTDQKIEMAMEKHEKARKEEEEKISGLIESHRNYLILMAFLGLGGVVLLCYLLNRLWKLEEFVNVKLPLLTSQRHTTFMKTVEDFVLKSFAALKNELKREPNRKSGSTKSGRHKNGKALARVLPEPDSFLMGPGLNGEIIEADFIDLS